MEPTDAISPTDAMSPVDPSLPAEPEAEAPSREGIALCLSGGGYRAMLFHLGSLWRLNDLGLLPRLDRVSSVSGGSITAGVLGQAWPKLAFDGVGVGQGFQGEVVAPVRRLAGTTIDVGAVLKGVFGRGSISDRVIAAYREHLFADRTLQDLPADEAGPRFIINAANVQSGALWRFSRPYTWDWRVGKIPNPTIPLATAVAASSAFPPFLSPLVLHLKEADYEPGTGEELQHPPYTTKVYLTDGGVYDNLGLQPAWSYPTVLVSDGGGQMEPKEEPERDWPRHLLRILNLIDNQVRSQRERQIVGAYELPPGDRNYRKGAFWGIRTDIAEYELPDSLPAPHEQTMKLARIPTRLARLGADDQDRLINWGFAVCDAALRRYFDESLPAPEGFPYPNRGVGQR